MNHPFEFCRNLISHPSARKDYLTNRQTRGLIGYFSNYIPEEVIAAAGFHPVRMIGRFTDSASASGPLLAPACSFARDCYAAACNNECSLLKEVVFPNSCDSMRVLLQMWQSRITAPPAYCLLHPVNTDQAAIDYFAQQIRRFASHLEELAGVAFSDEILLAAIEKYNQIRCLLRQVYHHRRTNPVCLKGSDMVALMTAGLIMDREEYNTILRRLVEQVNDVSVSEIQKKRIMIAGPLMDTVSLIETIEYFNAVVIYEDITNGARYADRDVETEGDLYENLARRYLLASPSPTRHSLLLEDATAFENLLGEVKPDGLIYINQKFCEPHIHNYLAKKAFLRQMKIPCMLLEIEHGRSSVDQRDLLRIESFLETLNI